MNTMFNWFVDVPNNHFSFNTPLLLAKVTSLLLVAWSLNSALARINPRWRVLMWRTTVAGLLVMLISAVIPIRWNISVTTAPPTISSTAASQTTSPIQAVQQKPISPAAPLSITDESVSESTSAEAESETTLTNSRNAIATRREPDSTRGTTAGFVWTTRGTLFAIWLAGVLLGLSRMALGRLRLLSICNESQSIPDRVQQIARDVLSGMKCKTSVTVRRSSRLQTPCVVGIFRPLILLPGDQCEIEHHDELPATFAHELAHVMGRDLGWNAAFNLTSILLWFHPLAWKLQVVHADACDAVCDAIAADYIGNAGAYAKTLARITLRSVQDNVVVGLAMARSANVRRRIESVHRNVMFRSRLPRRMTFSVVTLIAFAIVFMGSMSLKPIVAESNKGEQGQTKPANTNQKADPAAAPPAEKPMTRMLLVCVDDKTDKPLEGVQFHFHGLLSGARFDQKFESNSDGAAWFSREPWTRVEYLWMRANYPGHIPQHLVWREREKAIELPGQIELRFEVGSTIGGIVEDDQGRPIADAEVQISFPSTRPKFQKFFINAATLKTDEHGRWTYDSAPRDFDQISISVQHPDYLVKSGTQSGANWTTVLKQGVQVSGTVRDQEGNPIPGALAYLGGDRSGRDHPRAQTDEHGRFVLKNCRPGPILMTIQAENYSPQFKEITVDTETQPVGFQLKPGNTVKVRVVDIEGRPIPKVDLAVDSWEGYPNRLHRVTSNDLGEIIWKSAPPDSVSCDFLKSGYMYTRQVSLRPSDDFIEVVLKPELVIRGHLTNANTGQEINGFRVQFGYQRRDDWLGDVTTTFSNSDFRLRFNEPINSFEGYVLKFTADGFRPLTSRVFKVNEGEQNYDAKLEPAEGYWGTILQPDGQPAVDADVAFATRDRNVWLRSGRIDSVQNQASTTKTDSEGKFTFPADDANKFLLVIVHESGFATTFNDEFKNDTPIRLQKWGRLKGTVYEGQKPLSNQQVAYSFNNPKLERIFGSSFANQNNSTQSDADGRFEFDRIMPGTGSVSRVLLTQVLEITQWDYGWQTPVNVIADQTSDVKIGGTGMSVSGRIVLDHTLDGKTDWTTNQPAAAYRMDAVTKQPTQTREVYLGHISRNGRFTIQDIPAGEYLLSVTVNKKPVPNSGFNTIIGRGRKNFTVPEIEGKSSVEPMDLGEIQVKSE